MTASAATLTPLAWTAGRCTARAGSAPWGRTRCLGEAVANGRLCAKHATADAA